MAHVKYDAAVVRTRDIGSASELCRLICNGKFPCELLSAERHRWRSDQISQYLLEQSRLAEAERDDHETLSKQRAARFRAARRNSARSIRAPRPRPIDTLKSANSDDSAKSLRLKISRRGGAHA